jgi:hypothetical protein
LKKLSLLQGGFPKRWGKPCKLEISIAACMAAYYMATKIRGPESLSRFAFFASEVIRRLMAKLVGFNNSL